MSTDTFDLDALAPKPVTVHIGGRDISVQPPKTAVMLRMSRLKGLQDADKLPPEQLDQLAKDLEDIIVAVIPELEGATLSFGQQMKLLEIISEMATPPDVKALKAEGIEVGGKSEKKDQPA